MHSPADRILLHLKTRGPADTRALAVALAISRQATLQHLERLVFGGLVTHADERRGVGRPRRIWSLTPAAQARFPDTHAQLTLRLVQNALERGAPKLTAPVGVQVIPW